MIKKIEGMFGHLGQMKQFVIDAENMINKYGWQNRTVMPYGYPEKVTKIINDCKDYCHCTLGSQSLLIQLANGLVDILIAWEKQENEPKTTIKNKTTGKTFEIPSCLVDFITDEYEVLNV